MKMFLAIAAVMLMAVPTSLAQDARDSVVKVIVTYRAPDSGAPWSKQSPEEITGTGFVIDGERILTTGYVVEHASRVLVQPEGSSEKYTCNVDFLASGEDLAVLSIKNKNRAKEFFEGRPAIEIYAALPEAGDRVEVYGFPIGGSQMSITKGVISRFEYGFLYNLVGGLMLQIDAAVNEGNYGGPAIIDGKAVGIVHTSNNYGENIGYIIAAEEVLRFLEDIEDGSFDGAYRSLISGAHAVNKSLRDRLELPEDVTGVLYRTDKRGGFLEGDLRDDDLITRVGGFDVDNEGNIDLRDDIRLSMQYALNNSAGSDGQVPISVWRNGESLDLTIPATREWPFLLQYLGSDYPPYMIYGPVVFTKAYADYSTFNPYYMGIVQSPVLNRMFELPAFEGEELIVVLSPLFSHTTADGYEPLSMPTLARVNDVEIKNMAHLVEVLRDMEDEYVVFDWDERSSPPLIFRADEMTDATEEILDNNGIRRQMSPELLEVWEADD